MPNLYQFYLKLAAVVFCCFVLALLNLPGVGTATSAKRVVSRQSAAGQYSPFLYELAVSMVQSPIAALEVVVLVCPVYSMMGKRESRCTAVHAQHFCCRMGSKE
jgi:hypothetical protein